MRRKVTIKLAGSDSITIRQARLSGCLGVTDEATCDITIEERQPEAGKHIVLMHELLHLVDSQLVRVGLTKRRASHRWITHVAPNLVALLVEAGAYRGLTRRQLRAFWVGRNSKVRSRVRKNNRKGDGNANHR